MLHNIATHRFRVTTSLKRNHCSLFCPKAENIMFLELDLSPPAVFELDFSKDRAEQDPRALHLERLTRLDSLLERPAAARVRKSRSWCQQPKALPSSTTHLSLSSSNQRRQLSPTHE
ncbi:PREDICTED: kinesin-like protein KIF3C [Nanorana parkeri]|uniref:kinesin-like protein KIF3C n=1 Tax=Nanorana parkeri TaxID=125878 RepID=UPI00085471BF|nr:PREDICTED: kinesin-like protein KIF3C [Nanorana parkeri]